MIIANNVIHRWPAVAPRRAPCPPTAGPSACVVGLRCARRALNRGMPPPIATNPQWRRHHGRTTGVRHQHGARRERAGKGATITHEAGCTHFLIARERSRGARGHQPDAFRVQGGQGGCGMQGGRSDGGRAIGGPSTWHPRAPLCAQPPPWPEGVSERRTIEARGHLSCLGTPEFLNHESGCNTQSIASPCVCGGDPGSGTK